jgi:hypothetical protein
MTTYAANLESVAGVEKDFAMERQAYFEGRWARAADQKKKDNPYLSGTPEHAKWLLGWALADYLVWNAHSSKENVVIPNGRRSINHEFLRFRIKQNMKEIQSLMVNLASNIENLKKTLKIVEICREENNWRFP